MKQVNFLFAILITLILFHGSVYGFSLRPVCKVINENLPAHYILSEKVPAKDSDEIRLRVHNNSDCTLILEIDGDYSGSPLNNISVSIPIHYLIKNRFNDKAPILGYGWGDSVATYTLLGGDSALFSVQRKYIDKGFDILVPFNYEWEKSISISMLAGGTTHRIYFLFENYPNKRN